ncbi:uncharacterized protein LOC131210166 [Anopheles bellator]|uniref:uncharacterized protein LOC131210166 n=1 Tax=Anopheles bellator TaxID=139047 RepID=UPI002647DD3C|nr:uncharacterized protein LOC131210166 [Anopheles bellator]XP_058059354.1 uncharacterized protein LOC131210166 [Anopheles bellator]XP_058059356.1 uncharacterized protein LOC131210166 [Anopheles bellator]
MIFGDLVCCVHSVVLLQCCIAAVVASGGRQIVAAPQIRRPPPPTAGSFNRSGKYTDTLPGELNEECRLSQDCRQHAYACDARKQVCSCAEGYRADDAERMCLGAVGRRCMYDSHCVTNAYCKGQMICTCKREYGFPADDNWSCQASSAKASARIGTALLGTQHLLLALPVAIFSILALRVTAVAFRSTDDGAVP